MSASGREADFKGSRYRRLYESWAESDAIAERSEREFRSLRRDMSFVPTRKAPVKQMRQRCKTERRRNLQAMPNGPGWHPRVTASLGGLGSKSHDILAQSVTSGEDRGLGESKHEVHQKADPRRAKRR